MPMQILQIISQQRYFINNLILQVRVVFCYLRFWQYTQFLLNQYKALKVSHQMDYFESQSFQPQQSGQSAPLQQYADSNQYEFTTVNPTYQVQTQQFDFATYSAGQIQSGFGNTNDQNDFNQFEEDEAAKRIREQEERIQSLLREKNQRQWQEKESRKAEGRRQLQAYNQKKERQKSERAQQNLRKQAISKEELAKLNVQAGWKKVITNINVRQGEHKGKKDTNRMREAILHRREDDKR